MSRGRLLFLTALLATAAAAQENPTSAPVQGALGALASAVGENLEATGDLAPSLGVWISPEAGVLAQAFETELLARLGERGLRPERILAADARDAERAARTAGLRALVRLELTLSSRQLLARGDLLGTWENFWSGRAVTRPVTPVATLSLSVPADAQVLALALPGGASSAPVMVQRLTTFAAPTAGLTAADLDGDGRPELIVLAGAELHVVSASGARVAGFTLGTEPAPSRTPCREPYAVLSPDPGERTFTAFSCARAGGLRLRLTTAGALEPSGTPVTPDFAFGAGRVSAPLEPGVAALGARWRLEDGGELTWPAPVVAHAITRGPQDAWRALLLHSDGSATFLPDVSRSAERVRLASLATASTLVDLHGDGTLRLATTSPAVLPEQDALSLLPLPGTASEATVPLTTPLPGRVMQLLAVDLDGDGGQELVAGSLRPDGTSELLLIRLAPGVGIP